MSEREMSLTLMIGYFIGGHVGGWLHPASGLAPATDADYYRRLATLCEQGKFDLFFITDGLGVRTDNSEVHSRMGSFINVMEPLTLAANIAGATTRLGLGATISTTFSEPYNVARSFASLDHLSHGRAACNIVTSMTDHAAKSFGRDRLPPHATRYERASEYIDVLNKLWDSWDDDAFILDRQRGLTFDPKRQHFVDHTGTHFTVQGVLNIARPPQGRPVMVQAGGSETGKELAAQSAEAVFAASSTMEQAAAFYKDLKGRLPKYGRSPDSLKVMAGFPVVIADTDEAARAQYAELQALVHPEVARFRLSTDLETDLSDLSLDEPIPMERIPVRPNLGTSYFNRIVDMITAERLTLRQVSMRYGRSAVWHQGSPKTIADTMQAWFEAGVCDGFMLNFAMIAEGLEKFVAEVVPELQKRGIFRVDYTGETLRDHLGLAYPENQFRRTGAAQSAAG